MELPYKWKLWTPVISFGGASVGISYTYQFGSYYQTAQGIHVCFQILLSNKGSSTGNANISFPFTFQQQGGTTYNYAQTILANNMSSITGIVQLVTTSALNAAFFAQVSSGGPLTLTNSNFTNTSFLQCRDLFLPLQ